MIKILNYQIVYQVQESQQGIQCLNCKSVTAQIAVDQLKWASPLVSSSGLNVPEQTKRIDISGNRVEWLCWFSDPDKGT